MPIRIVIDVRYIKDFGIGTYIRNIVRALSDLDHENSYVLAALDQDRDEFANLSPNFEVAIYHPPRQKFWDDIAFSWFLKSLAPDLIHIPLNSVPLFTPKPYVVTMHDMSSFLFSGRAGLNENLRMHRFVRGLKRAHRVIAVSESTRRDVSNLLGIGRERLRQVYGAPDPRFLTQVPDEQRLKIVERYQLQHPYLLYAGRIRPHKNIPRIIEAFAFLRAELESHPKYRDLKLIIIGDEIQKHPEVRRAMIQTRSEQSVRFLGFVSFDSLKAFYSSAEVFVFPSLYEGFGLPPLEAMATGTPVVTSSVSSLPEVVGQAAMIVNPENVFDIARGIREVLLDPDTRARLIADGYKQVKRFSWTDTAAQVLDIYREVAPGS